MKKIAVIIAAAAIAVSASAQQRTVLTASKWSDNIYVGAAVGAQTKAMNSDMGSFKAFDPNFTLMVGKNFNPVFGLRVEGVARFNAHSSDSEWGGANTMGSTTFVNGVDVNLLSTWNFMNLFGGYKGEPRAFEITGLFGLGWTKIFNADKNSLITSKIGLDFAYNFGSDKQWQIFIEPAITYGLQAYGNEPSPTAFQYDGNRANLDLKAGVIYKLPCSNGKHNFALEAVRDQSEVDALNAQINSIRGEIDQVNAATAAATAQAADLQKQLTDCQNKPVVEERANLAPSVVFQQGKSVVRNSQMANVEMIAQYMKKNPDAKVKVSGYASPEGSKKLNQKLSEKRAEAVKKVLVKKYKIAADRLETEGLGATDKLFDEVEFNRVALFNDVTTK